MTYTTADQAAAIAHELVCHIDDLVDEHERLETPDGDHSFEAEDTGTTGNDLSFYVTMKDGNRFRVTVEHVPDTVTQESFAVTMLGMVPGRATA